MTPRLNQLPAFILSAGFLYYRRDVTLVPDEVFDSWCERLREGYRKARHPHKLLISPEQLRAGTLFDMKDSDYPRVARHSAVRAYLEMGLLDVTFEELLALRRARPRAGHHFTVKDLEQRHLDHWIHLYKRNQQWRIRSK